MSPSQPSPGRRLVSLDAYRGITVFLLVAEAALVYRALLGMVPEGSFGFTFFLRFTHHPWNGLRFWDLNQPVVMFIAGMNPIFIYLFAEILGHGWLMEFVRSFNFGFPGLSENLPALLNAFFSLALLWYICCFLYKNKIFFRI